MNPIGTKAGVAAALRRLEALEANHEVSPLGELVSLRARTHGTVKAIDVFERGQHATYLEMDLESNRYANALLAAGVRKGDRIGLMLPNRIEFPLLWFACAKLGAVVVPLNMRYTPREIEYVLSDTQAKFAVVDETAWAAFRAVDPWPRDLDMQRVFVTGDGGAVPSLAGLLAGASDAPVQEDVSATDLLNIQYTSGTTGFPKGCMIGHDYWSVSSMGSASTDHRPYAHYLCWAPFFYGNGPAQLLRSYRQGGTLYLAEKLSSTRFLDWLIRYGIEWCMLPAAVAQVLAAGEGPQTFLELVWQDGSWTKDLARQFRERCGVPSQMSYGSTEVAWGTMMCSDVDGAEVAGTVGLRAPFRTLRLVNEDGGPTPVGDVGELWVKGRGMFKGYWNRPQANSEAFEGEWFKTGDLMRRDEQGFYWLVGRKKDMIRRSSENIAAREVEAIIREIPGVADVAAVPVPDAKRGEEVKIYVELAESITPADVSVERIVGHARARLATFKVPRYIAFIGSLPRTTSSNKVLKRELTDVADPLVGVYDTEQRRWRPGGTQ
ncbi:class I adenylate-forming enzyme family protein [Bradyrhizobium vignae]|uniref:Acyl-CoA synthetase (AMP-forming)/AMP-acid ligase II n=1 Tax=Bradyrhizobium vignae TaxID=1549949 RepID=A0A2U3Q9M4_9BRAD|nr:class I adenylate-forming enzyme family protein [Bradyrhizobium vignae]SPP98102.1 Acyl-CoA synthetase (AMP-forming)/AMP-acid ligase II [Bradyrhizobium vignae]